MVLLNLKVQYNDLHAVLYCTLQLFRYCIEHCYGQTYLHPQYMHTCVHMPSTSKVNMACTSVDGVQVAMVTVLILIPMKFATTVEMMWMLMGWETEREMWRVWGMTDQQGRKVTKPCMRMLQGRQRRINCTLVASYLVR